MHSSTKGSLLLHTVKRHSDEGGVLIFCRTEVECERIGSIVQREGNDDVRMYHADMSKQYRRQTAEMFSRREVTVLVCTVAFGMGVDVAEVCCVINWRAPASLEQYVQEIGRAGRSGDDATCILFHGGNVYDDATKRIPSCHRARKELLKEASIMQSLCGLA
jgi:ATP-dependent DNA helicase RecQ